MSITCSEIIWSHILLTEHEFPQDVPTPLYANNTSVIYIASNLVFHEHTKHIKVDYHFIREAYNNHAISLSESLLNFKLQIYLPMLFPALVISYLLAN